MKKSILVILFVFQIFSFGQTIEEPINPTGAAVIRDEERRIGSGENEDYLSRRKSTAKLRLPEELKPRLEITKADKTKYENYLKGSKIQLAKIWNNNCVNLGKVVDVEKDKDCLALAGYEVGSVYSFENKDYFLQNDFGIFANRIYPNAAIELSKEKFKSANIHSNGQNYLTQIMTDLGEVSPANIEKDNLDVRTLAAVQLFDKNGKTIWKANQKNSELKYSDDLPALINHTYLLRSVFIDGQSPEYLRYKETVYAFQFVGFENNIAVILWKKITTKWA